MEACEIRDDLAICWLEAADQVKKAQRQVDRAFTQTQQEDAAAYLDRVNGYQASALNSLLAHCDQHECMSDEIQGMLPEEPVLRAG